MFGGEFSQTYHETVLEMNVQKLAVSAQDFSSEVESVFLHIKIQSTNSPPYPMSAQG